MTTVREETVTRSIRRGATHLTDFLVYRPQPPLSAFVELFWDCDGYDPDHRIERRLPTGSACLVINLREDEFRIRDQCSPDRFHVHRGSVLSGPRSRHYILETRFQSSTIGVHFKPGGAARFFDVPASEFLDTHRSLDTLWGDAADRLRQMLLEARDGRRRIEILERALLNRLRLSSRRHPAVERALREIERPIAAEGLSALAERLGLSHRRFIDVFKITVGMTPKLYSRVRRFQSTLRHLRTTSCPDGADLAQECGYYDQAHMIHEFRNFSGLTPSEYQAHQVDHQNHVPMEATRILSAGPAPARKRGCTAGYEGKSR